MPATALGSSGAKFHSAADSLQLTIGTPTALAAAIANMTIGSAVSFTNGTATGQMNAGFSVAAQSLTSSPTSFTLNNASVSDALNNTITMVRCKAVTIYAPTTNTAAILLTGSGLNQILGAATSLNPGVTLNAGGVFSYADPTGVSMSANSVFTFSGVGAGTQTAQILIAGTQ